jgi:hypothetical protein
MPVGKMRCPHCFVSGQAFAKKLAFVGLKIYQKKHLIPLRRWGSSVQTGWTQHNLFLPSQARTISSKKTVKIQFWIVNKLIVYKYHEWLWSGVGWWEQDFSMLAPPPHKVRDKIFLMHNLWKHPDYAWRFSIQLLFVSIPCSN